MFAHVFKWSLFVCAGDLAAGRLPRADVGQHAELHLGLRAISVTFLLCLPLLSLFLLNLLSLFCSLFSRYFLLFFFSHFVLRQVEKLLYFYSFAICRHIAERTTGEHFERKGKGITVRYRGLAKAHKQRCRCLRSKDQSSSGMHFGPFLRGCVVVLSQAGR